MPCYRFQISGRVQGVFFRASTEEKARSLNLSGWVRNLPNGDVETVACGLEQQLQSFRHWLKQGPPLAKVEQVSETVIDNKSFSRFEVRY